MLRALLVMVALGVPNAMAYIDPGSGSAIMSAIVGFFVAFGLAIKTYWYRIKSFFVKSNKDDNENPTEKTQ